ncbi:unnamed protein product [Effrenium voratum]|nr:unnamed protein product [Effrenium voratum]
MDEVAYTKAIGARGNWQEALHLLQQLDLSTLRRTPVVCSAAISACGKGKRWREALSLLYDSEENVVVFNVAISACARSSRWPEAVGLLKKLQKSHLQPDAFSLGSTLDALDKGSRWQQALRLFASLPRRTESPKVASPRPWPCSAPSRHRWGRPARWRRTPCAPSC